MVIKERIIERMKLIDVSVDEVAQELGIDQSTFYRKLAGGCTKFTLAQLQKLIEVLRFSPEEASKIFFAE